MYYDTLLINSEKGKVKVFRKSINEWNQIFSQYKNLPSYCIMEQVTDRYCHLANIEGYDCIELWADDICLRTMDRICMGHRKLRLFPWFLI
jgi:hypothetical protein